MKDLATRLAQALPVKTGLGLAVSGGGDSMAMLHLLAPLAPRVATVHHHLRPEADAEIALVSRTCAALGLRHDVLHWHWNGRGNLADAARRARRDLLAAWNPVVLLAHTRDDLAETFLMRLSRGSGVDGLSAMPALFRHQGATFLRPLLDLSREELRAQLQALGATWAEDASNENPKYLRARTRKALAGLDISPQTLAATATRMAEAREALDALADLFSPQSFTQTPASLQVTALSDAPAETRRRLLCRALSWLNPAPYPPRAEALARFLQALLAGRSSTLAGVRHEKGHLFREARSLPAPAPADQIWDARFTALAPPGATLGPLGPDLPPSWRDHGLPRAALASSPCLRLKSEILCAPAIGVNHPETTIRAVLPRFGPLTAALSH